MTLIEVYESAQELNADERRALVKMLVDTLDSHPQRKLSDLRGLGAYIWEGVDTQAYLDELRDDWDMKK